ncbi:MAG: zinc ribbon domain-containing protein [Armatimonadota bacterium]|nr:zinc ribbon domain-containing protein [Armatimonadota bacterium]
MYPPEVYGPSWFTGWIIGIIIIDAIVCAGLSGYVADRKGYSNGGWAACGFFFGILGLIAAAGLPRITGTADYMAKKCPDCGEPIRIEARVCRFCGHKYDESQVINELGLALDSEDDACVRQALLELLKEIESKEEKQSGP